MIINQISLKNRAVPAMIFSFLSPAIPSFILRSRFYLLTDEYKQNSSSMGYKGGGLA
jgi:hypothetical protein